MNFVGEKKEAPKSLIRPLVQTAAALGIIQGVVWAVLSAISISLYHIEDLTLETQSMGSMIYYLYLKSGPQDFDISIIITPDEFSYFMYIYLILSITWLIVSSVTLSATMRDHQQKYYRQFVTAWIVVTALVSLLDLILLFLLSYDYNKYQSYDWEMTSVGIVMTLAARGFVLWVVNFVFLVILSKHSYQMHKEKVNKSPNRENRSAIDAYSRSRPDLPWQTPYDDRKRFDNMGFRDDDEDPFRSKQNSNIRQNNRNIDYVAPIAPRLGRNESPWNKGPPHRDVGNGFPRAYSNQEPPRTAKIGRQQDRRSPPLNVDPPYVQPSPYIPDPDYSPPGSPKVRGVLRPKSNYAMY